MRVCGFPDWLIFMKQKLVWRHVWKNGSHFFEYCLSVTFRKDFTMSWLSQRLCLLSRQNSILRNQIQHCVTAHRLYASALNSEEDNKYDNQGRQFKQSERSNKSKKNSKLHNRKFTDVENETDRIHNEKLLNLDESDSFGRFGPAEQQRKKFSFGNRGQASNVQPDYRTDFSTRYDQFPRNRTQVKDYTRRSNRTDRSPERDRNGVPRYSSSYWRPDRRTDYSAHDLKDEFTKRSGALEESNSFGDLADTHTHTGAESLLTEIGSHNERFADDEDDKDRIRLKKVYKKDIAWYGRWIEKLGKEGKIREAIAVLEERMMRRDRVQPSQYTFTTLIGVLGRVGYTKKAFQLFNKMKKMGLEPEDPTYTALFNACSNSPWKEDGLNRAHRLRHLMRMKNYEPNLVTYHAMIKAFGVLGDIGTAFNIMDELAKRFRPNPETFSFLLMACISDRKAGFKHAVEVWRLLEVYDVKPDVPLYNLLLRSVRDCQAGDQHTVNQLLDQTRSNSQDSTDQDLKLIARAKNSDEHSSQPKLIGQAEHKQLSVPTSETRDHGDADHEVDKTSTGEWWENDANSNLPSTVVSPLETNLPNLLNSQCDLSQVVSLGPLTRPEDRLAVIGGAVGLLEAMKQNAADPDIRTFSQLLEVAPPTVEAETALVAKMESMGVKPDITFFNTLIHRRCLRREVSAARDVLQLVTAFHLQPDMKTFGCLAMTCRNKKTGIQFLEDMEQSGLSPNIEVLGTLSYASNLDFDYKLMVLKTVESLDLKPNDKYLQAVESSIRKAKHKIVQVESGQIVDGYISSQYFISSFDKFMDYYKDWLHRTTFQETPHPWEDFRESKTKDFEAVN